MNEVFDPNPAAAVLAAAWRSGRLLDELPVACRPRSMAEGYDVQDRLVSVLGQSVVGWKLGAGSVLQKRQSGVGRSIAGQVLDSRRFACDSTVMLSNSAPVTIEFEIAFVLGRDIAPDDRLDSPFDAVAEVRPTFELVLSRFVDRRAVGWPSFAADNSGFDALIVGDPIDPNSIDELRRTLVVRHDGADAARAVSGEDFTDPVGAFRDLIAIARERGRVLPKGSIISTGTASKPFAVAAAQARISAQFLDTELAFQMQVRATPL